jgi:hypothetical protein
LSEFEVLETFEDGRCRVRFIAGGLAGRIVTTFPTSYGWSPPATAREQRPRRRESPETRAARLLRSLLSPEQKADWRARRKFFVPTEFGRLEFGELFNIGFWPKDGGEYRLCVVPTGRQLPLPDIWTNLLLALSSDPARFFWVANWRRPPNGTLHLGPVPGFSRLT